MAGIGKGSMAQVLVWVWIGLRFPSGPPAGEMIVQFQRKCDFTYQEPKTELMDRLVANVTPMWKGGCTGVAECLIEDRGVCGRVEVRVRYVENVDKSKGEWSERWVGDGDGGGDGEGSQVSD